MLFHTDSRPEATITGGKQEEGEEGEAEKSPASHTSCTASVHDEVQFRIPSNSPFAAAIELGRPITERSPAPPATNANTRPTLPVIAPGITCGICGDTFGRQEACCPTFLLSSPLIITVADVIGWASV